MHLPYVVEYTPVLEHTLYPSIFYQIQKVVVIVNVV